MAIIERDGELLMELRSDCERWGLPGGAVEARESVGDALRREIFEETGLSIVEYKLFGVFSDPRRIVAYPDGNVVRLLSFVYCVEVEDLEPLRTSGESLAFEFFGEDRLRSLDVVETAKPIIEEYLSPGTAKPVFLD